MGGGPSLRKRENKWISTGKNRGGWREQPKEKRKQMD